MAEAVDKVDSLRLNRFETKRLLWALVLSLLLHFLVWGGYELGKKTGLWQRWHWPAMLHLAKKKSPPPVLPPSDPTIFLDVDPDQATPDAPKDAKYYSSKNSRAANPDANQDSNQPKLTGKQKDVPKTKDVPRQPNVKPQPPQPEPQPQKEAPPAQPKPAELPGDTKLAKLETSPDKTKETPTEKPRTLKQARAQQSNLFPSMAMNQDGGTRRMALQPSFDAKATPFGDYDRRFIDAVTQRWYDLLDSQQFSQDRSGKVTLRFRLNFDGTVGNMEVLENTVGELLGYVCQKSITDPTFEPWPSDMRRMVGANYREIVFTFYYY